MDLDPESVFPMSKGTRAFICQEGRKIEPSPDLLKEEHDKSLKFSESWNIAVNSEFCLYLVHCIFLLNEYVIPRKKEMTIDSGCSKDMLRGLVPVSKSLGNNKLSSCSHCGWFGPFRKHVAMSRCNFFFPPANRGKRYWHLAFSDWRPRMLMNIPQCKGTDCTEKSSSKGQSFPR